MSIFTEKQWRIFNRIRRKYKVSLEFLKFNMLKILKFIAYYGRRLHFVLKRSAERNSRNQTVVIKYNRLMRSLFDEAYRKRIKRRKRHIKQWSKRIVMYLRKTKGVKEYTIVKKLRNTVQNSILPDDLTRQLKEQLELLRSGKRCSQLMDASFNDGDKRGIEKSFLETTEISSENSLNETIKSNEDQDTQPKIDEFILNEKTGMLESSRIENTSNDVSESSVTTKMVTKNTSNILDVLMNKVRVSQSTSFVKSTSLSSLLNSTGDNDTSIDSGEEFLGFAEEESVPGMMRTPLVPPVFRSKEDKSAFVSESLDEYFRENSLNRITDDIGQMNETLPSKRKIRQANIDGLMTLNSKPPAFYMPAVPESLQKLRTVAERRQYLQKFSKNIKLAIINNEAAIYRELQRKVRQPKIKICLQQTMQANNSQMSFTRQGWQAASYITTELNKFYYQKLKLPEEKICVELRGVRGNNSDQYKTPYVSKVASLNPLKCTRSCMDCLVSQCLKPISTYNNRKKLCKEPYRSIFKPCPLSEKPRQPLLDEDAAEILLNGGGMSVVQLPSVQLQVNPELGRPLHDIAKRYLEYILPYEGITREWAQFSISTLQVPSSTKTSINQKNSFDFTIPYVNDRSHILVRRLVDRSEKIDPHFLCESSDKNNRSGLSFCANINENDSIQVECANVLADMINAVAISFSENSFIKDDADVPVSDISLKTAEECILNSSKEKYKGRPKLTATQKVNSTAPKKSRLISELRRLNATIIETNAQHNNDKKLCTKEFCTLGCICPSLSDGHPLKEHCGKPRCMLQCVCKGSTPSKILRLETDGRSITTEDAYNMRLQATARLARIEKEFTSTIVVTENETLLINETEYDKKRRCTKMPKRYQDYRDTDNEFGRISPVKSFSTTPTIDTNETKSISGTMMPEVLCGLEGPVYVKDVVLAKLKHCSVPLVPFKECQNMAVWCMVHHMYKCFCGGSALEGKPLDIEKEDPDKLVSELKKNDGPMKSTYSSKAYYSFESAEEDSMQSLPKKRKNSEEKEIVKKKDHEFHEKYNGYKKSHTSEMDKSQMKLQKKQQNTESDFIKNFFRDRDYLGCCRFIPVPSRTYKSINRKRRKRTFASIEKAEDSSSQLLLNEHIMRTVYYYKELHQVDKVKKEVLDDESTKEEEKYRSTYQEKSQLPAIDDKNSVKESQNVGEKSLNDDAMEIGENKQLSDIKTAKDKHMKNLEAKRNEETEQEKPIDNSLLVRRKMKKNKKVEKCEEKTLELQPGKDKMDKSESETEKYKEKNKTQKRDQGSNNNDSEPKIKKRKKKDQTCVNNEMSATNSRSDEKDSNPVLKETLVTPKIAACYSIKSQNEPQTDQNQNLNMNADAGLSSFSEGLRENYNEVIKQLNCLVSRKMHDIDNALKRDSKIVPPPTENVLCVLQWKNFLGAFQEGLIYIWEIKMKTRTFLAATVQNIIPMVLGALAVISITQTPISRLPLIGQMIVQGYQPDESVCLAVIMQGRKHYWFVKGFLQPNVNNACLRPTPETHPELTKKINTLCASLIKQRSKDLERREALKRNHHQQQQQQQQSKNSLFVPSTSNNNINDHQQQDQQQQQQQQQQPQQQQKLQNQNEIPDLEKNKLIDFIQFGGNNLCSNIEINKPTNPEQILHEMRLPEFHANDHSWYVLDLFNDFSHIFVPSQKEIVSLDRVQRLINLSIEKQKVIRIQFLKRACFNAFIVPTSKRKMFFGPFPLNAEAPLLVLLQSVDGKMMTREAYQQMHKIPIKSLGETTSFWLKQINGKLYFDDVISESNTESHKSVDHKADEIQPLIQVQSPTANNIITTNTITKTDTVPTAIVATTNTTNATNILAALKEDWDDDDCVIIENTNDENPKHQKLSKHLQEVDTILKNSKPLHQNDQGITGVTPFFTQKIDHEPKSVSKIINSSQETPSRLLSTLYNNAQLVPSTNPIPSLIDAEKSLKKPISTMQDLKDHQSTKSTNVATTIIPKASIIASTPKIVQLPKLSENAPIAEHPLEELRRKGVVTNRPATFKFPKSNGNNLHTVSTVISNKLAKKNLDTIQNQPSKEIIPNFLPRAKNSTAIGTPTTTATKVTPLSSDTVITNTSTGSKVATTTTTITSPISTPPQFPASKPQFPLTLISANASPLTSTTSQLHSSKQISSKFSPISAPAHAHTPAQILNSGGNVPVRSLSSGFIKIPPTTLSSNTAVATSASASTSASTSTLSSFKNTSNNALKLLAKPKINTQLNTLQPPKKIVTQNMPIIATVKGATKTPLNFHRTPQNTTTSTATTVATSSASATAFPNQLNLSANNKPVRKIGQQYVKIPVKQPEKLLTKQKAIETKLNLPTSFIEGSNSSQDKSKCNTTLNSATSNRSSTTNVDGICGFLCSNRPGLPRCPTKRTQFEYIIKVPGFGLAKASGIVKANTFLNHHVAKKYPHLDNSSVWTFVPQSNMNKPVNNTLTTSSSKVQQQHFENQKEHTSPQLAKKTPTPVPTSSKAQFSVQQMMQRTEKDEKQSSFKSILSSITETILIDDDDDD